MSKVRLIFRMLSYWHIGSGHTEGANLDALVLKTPAGLPYIPGKTIKGLLRDAVATLVEHSLINEDLVEEYFGTDDQDSVSRYETKHGELNFSNATLDSGFISWAKERSEEVNMLYLYNYIPSTKVDKYGIAKDKNLRRIEATVPLTLTSEISTDINNHDWIITVKDAVKLIRFIGSYRHRGFGKTQLIIEEIK